MVTQNADFWSSRQEGEGHIDNTLQADGTVSSVGGGSGSAEEKLKYFAKHIWNVQSQSHDATITGSETRIAHYEVGRSVGGTWDVNNPNAAPPTPIIPVTPK